MCRTRSILSVSWTPISIAPSDRVSRPIPDPSRLTDSTIGGPYSLPPLQVPCDPQESVRESLRYSVTASLQVRFAQRVGELYIIIHPTNVATRQLPVTQRGLPRCRRRPINGETAQAFTGMISSCHPLPSFTQPPSFLL